MCVLIAELCPILYDPMDCKLPASSVHEISQTRILEWVAISFSRGLPDPLIKPMSPALQVISYIAGGFFSAKPPGIPNLELQRTKTGESYGSL